MGGPRAAAGAAGTFYERLCVILGQVAATQGDAIDAAARRCADAISADGFVHLFGAGHSHMPPIDVYPRIGGIEGFNPLVELAMSRFSNVVGTDGILQASFLERVEGYAEVVLQASPVEPPDVMVVFSNSGINAITVEMAQGCHARGIPVVAVTSVAHSSSTGSRHSSGLKLMDVADVVIDTCVPAGDALVAIPGLAHATGGSSTIVSMAVAQSLVAATAELLLERGIVPLQIHSHNRRDEGEAEAESAMEAAVGSWGRRMGRRLEQLSIARPGHRHD